MVRKYRKKSSNYTNWYNPGHGKMVSYTRRGPRYFIGKSARSYFVPGEYKGKAVAVAVQTAAGDVFPITPTTMRVLQTYRTPVTPARFIEAPVPVRYMQIHQGPSSLGKRRASFGDAPMAQNQGFGKKRRLR